MDNKHAIWKHESDGKILTGSYTYNWAKNSFHIRLDRTPNDTHEKSFYIHDDSPEWSGFKLIRDDKERAAIIKELQDRKCICKNQKDINCRVCFDDKDRKIHQLEQENKQLRTLVKSKHGK